MMSLAEAERILRWTVAHRYVQVVPGTIVDRITGESRGGSVWDQDGSPVVLFVDLLPGEKPSDLPGLTPGCKVYSVESGEHMRRV